MMSTIAWSFIVLWILIILISVSTSEDMSRAEIEETGKVLFRALRNSDCKIDCSNRKRRPVCGSDGVMYSSRCAIKRAKRCENRRIKIKPKSFCPASATSTKCMQEREEAQAIARRPRVGIFIPECTRDGMFAEVQCHAATGYCWCVTKEGKLIPGTSIQNKRPACDSKKGKRRSGRKSKRHRRKGRVCKQSDRNEFNRNLVEAFKQEYQRALAADRINLDRTTNENGVLEPLDKRVVEWKFSSLDANNDNKLRRREVRALKRMVKKVIRPRSCAKNFASYCDLDQNKRIERKEWSICLGVDIESARQAMNNTGETKEQSTQGNQDTTDIEVEPKIIVDFPPPKGGGRGKWSSTGLNTPRPDPPEPSPEKEDKTRSCTEERQAALLQHQADPDGGTFIPACTEDGKWVREQCHKSSQYCWCVNENEGIPLPGTTSAKGVRPSCDLATEREMKGCPYPRKRRFLTDMLEKLTIEMNIYAQNGTDRSKLPDPSSNMSIHERAVNWKFRVLDVNSNNVLERKELKPFRKDIPRRKDTRKCRRNFIRFCDADTNRKVTLDEWNDCMKLKYNGGILHPNRNGAKNPFNHILQPS